MGYLMLNSNNDALNFSTFIAADVAHVKFSSFTLILFNSTLTSVWCDCFIIYKNSQESES